MAITHVKVTYSVQPETASRVQELATKWGVPKSEVIRRAVEKISDGSLAPIRQAAIEALKKITESPVLTKTEARRRSLEVRRMRRAF